MVHKIYQNNEFTVKIFSAYANKQAVTKPDKCEKKKRLYFYKKLVCKKRHSTTSSRMELLVFTLKYLFSTRTSALRHVLTTTASSFYW